MSHAELRTLTGHPTDQTYLAVTGTDSGTRRSLDTQNLPSGTDRYLSRINVRHTSATAANSLVWALTNPSASAKSVFIETIHAAVSFEEITLLTAATLRYDLLRFSSGTPTGGSALSPVKCLNSNPTSAVTDIRSAAAGLTSGGIVRETAWAVIGCPGVQGCLREFVFKEAAFVLAPGEGFGFSLNVTAAAGLVLSGFVLWGER